MADDHPREGVEGDAIASPGRTPLIRDVHAACREVGFRPRVCLHAAPDAPSRG